MSAIDGEERRSRRRDVRAAVYSLVAVVAGAWLLWGALEHRRFLAELSETGTTVTARVDAVRRFDLREKVELRISVTYEADGRSIRRNFEVGPELFAALNADVAATRSATVRVRYLRSDPRRAIVVDADVGPTASDEWMLGAGLLGLGVGGLCVVAWRRRARAREA